MKSQRRLPLLLLAAVAMVAVALPAAAQNNRPVTDVISGPGRTAVEEGALDYFHLTRDVLGARSRGMGGAGLSMPGDIDLYSLNPAAVMGNARWQLVSEAVLQSGSAGVNSFPSKLVLGVNPATGEEFSLDASGYRVSPNFAFDYGHLTLGIPVVLFGERGTVGLSYQRQRYSPQQDETRFEAVGPVTQNIPATIGIGVQPDGGYDAMTVTLARQFGRFSLGANANMMSGTLQREENVGAAVFGQVQASGGSRYSQDFNSISFDVGALADLGRLNLGASLFLAHDMKYDQGILIKNPLPNTQDPTSPVFQIEAPVLEYTQSIPTQWGLGGSFDVTNRITVAVDVWGQAWSGSEITRNELSAAPTYSEDPYGIATIDGSDTTYFGFDMTAFDFAMIQGTGDESFSAQMKDNTSFRFGIQWMTKDSGRVKVPVWFGFRNETVTLPNIQVSDPYDQYLGLVEDWWRYVYSGDEPTGDVDPAAIDAALKDVLEHNQLMFASENSRASTFTFGAGITWDRVTLETSVSARSHDLDKFFFQKFDPTTTKTAEGQNYGPVNPFATGTQETRTVTSLSFGARMTF